MNRAMVEVLLAAVLPAAAGFCAGWVWAYRRSVRRLRRALSAAAGQAQRAESATARGRLLALANAATTGVVVTHPGALPTPSPSRLLAPDTRTGTLPDAYGDSVTPAPGCCADCDEALDVPRRAGVTR